MTQHYSAEDWARVEDAVGLALRQSEAERSRMLHALRTSDPNLARRVEQVIGLQDKAEAYFHGLARRMLGGSPLNGLTGRRLGRYELGAVVGRGGTGSVLRARDTSSGLHVAVKVLHGRLRLDPEARRRFLVEARAVARMEHPYIARILDVGESEDGTTYLVMPLYHSALSTGRRWPEQEAVSFAAAVANALAYAHRKGVLHRDIKPSNILMTKEGDPVIVDFGIAKILADPTLTPMGAKLGTIAYMSPEQARGERTAATTDIWSLGVVLYQLLSGRRPFEGANPLEVIGKVRDEPPPPLPSDISSACARIVFRCLQKRPRDRWASAALLERQLRRLAPGPPQGFWRRILAGGRYSPWRRGRDA
ncbi:MAG: serine/threonine protein kinase [Rhodothermales bacterium]|nr:serine/threonine protein kinase [Rhodothermales bacterium]MBO6778074.1 serine/threonine protein kinase [Rhodothermales bacterium]